MIKSANNYPISQLFDINSKTIYNIPRYQRECGHEEKCCDFTQQIEARTENLAHLAFQLFQLLKDNT